MASRRSVVRHYSKLELHFNDPTWATIVMVLLVCGAVLEVRVFYVYLVGLAHDDQLKRSWKRVWVWKK